MKKRRLIILAGLAVVVAALAIWMVMVATEPTEPVYEGKKLSEWLVTINSTNQIERDPAWKAISSMGTNAIPYLTQRLKREALENYWVRKLGKVLGAQQTFLRLKSYEGIRRVDFAIRAIGEPAGPAFEKLISESSNDEVIFEAYRATVFAGYGLDGNFGLKISSNAMAKVNAASNTLFAPKATATRNADGK